MATVSVGDIITAAQYNDLQTRTQTVVGNGSGNYGYGQSLTSSAVAIGDTVLAIHMNNLYTDISKAYVHQTNGLPAGIAQLSIGDEIAANTSTDPDGTIKGYNDYDAAIAYIETNRLVANAGQMSAESKISSARSTAWGGGATDVITHTVSVTFPGGYSTKNTDGSTYNPVTGADHMRHYFNAGGEIRFSASLSGGSGAKYNDWNAILTNMGTIKFARSGTSATGTGTGSSIGYANITGNYQTIFVKTGSGVYAENDYNIAARLVGSDTLQFRIQFRDDDQGDDQGGPGSTGPVDENVSGTVTSSISQYRATGSYVEVPTPTYNNDSTL